MIKKILKFGFVLALILLPAVLLAQPGPPGGPPGPPGGGGIPPCWPPPCVPIDGGISLLVAAGLALGGKKAYDLHKKNK